MGLKVSSKQCSPHPTLPDGGSASAPTPSCLAFVLVPLEPARFQWRLGPHEGLLPGSGYPVQAKFIVEGMHTKIKVLKMNWLLSGFCRFWIEQKERAKQGDRVSRTAAGSWEDGPGVSAFVLNQGRPLGLSLPALAAESVEPLATGSPQILGEGCPGCCGVRLLGPGDVWR